MRFAPNIRGYDNKNEKRWWTVPTGEKSARGQGESLSDRGESMEGGGEGKVGPRQTGRLIYNRVNTAITSTSLQSLLFLPQTYISKQKETRTKYFRLLPVTICGPPVLLNHRASVRYQVTPVYMIV